MDNIDIFLISGIMIARIVLIVTVDHKQEAYGLLNVVR